MKMNVTVAIPPPSQPISFDQLVTLGLDAISHRWRDPAFAQMANQMNPAHAAREICTLRLGLGRQTGKSEFIIQNARPNDVVLCYNTGLAHNLMHRGLSKQALVVTPTTIVNALGARNMHRSTCHTIFVDDASFINSTTAGSDAIDTLYDMLTSRNTLITQRFILLG